MNYIVPFEFCNLASIIRYFVFRGVEYQHLDQKSILDAKNDVVVIPGVGSFQNGMDFLLTSKLVDTIRNHHSSGGRVVGICLGMQLMFHKSDESPGVDGLRLLSGTVKKLSNELDSVPRIGWDNVSIIGDHLSYSRFDNFSFNDIGERVLPADFYFVHSFHCIPDDRTIVSSSFRHGGHQLCASVEGTSLFGFQFHPEKSGPAGYKVLDAIFSV